MTSNRKIESQDNITCLNSFKKSKELSDYLSRGREPLVDSHLDNVYANEDHPSFQNRLNSIKHTLDKLNTLIEKINEIEKNEK